MHFLSSSRTAVGPLVTILVSDIFFFAMQLFDILTIDTFAFLYFNLCFNELNSKKMLTKSLTIKLTFYMMHTVNKEHHTDAYKR